MADIEKVEEIWTKKHIDPASLSQTPPKRTECYSPHLHLHLHTHFSHSRYSKQTSICMETCATLCYSLMLMLCVHIHTHTHRTTLLPTSITLHNHTSFLGHYTPEPCTLFHCDVTGFPISCFLFTKHWQIVPHPLLIYALFLSARCL